MCLQQPGPVNHSPWSIDHPEARTIQMRIDSAFKTVDCLVHLIHVCAQACARASLWGEDSVQG